MKLIKVTTSFILLAVLSGCSVDINEYKKTNPALDIKTYFTGNLVAWGMLQDFTDKVTRRFCVEINGSWQDNQGILKETFYWDDGEISYRDWKLVKHANGRYSGSAADVIGVAKGQQQGFAFNWKYILRVPIDGSNYQFNIDDWMYKLDEHRVMNKSGMYKFGVHVANITIFFDKSPHIKKCDLNKS